MAQGYDTKYASRFSVRITGADQVKAMLQRASKAGREAARKALEAAADKALKIAEPITPKDDEDGGDLRGSLRRTRVTLTKAGKSTVSLLAGGEMLKDGLRATSYAVKQHEDLSYVHTEPGTGPKFLERAALAIAPELEPALKQALGEEIG